MALQSIAIQVLPFCGFLNVVGELFDTTLWRGIDPQGHQLRGIVQAQKNRSPTTTPRTGFKPTIPIYEKI